MLHVHSAAKTRKGESFRVRAMGRSPCCPKVGLRRGPWSPKEDALLSSYIQQHGVGRWRSLPEKAGLLRCGKSCRLRWMNYLRPGIKRGNMSEAEIDLILRLHRLLGNRWSLIAGRIPGRTDNEIKNYWNTHLHKKTTTSPSRHKEVVKSEGGRNSICSSKNDNSATQGTKIYAPKAIRICASTSVKKLQPPPPPPPVEVEEADLLGLGWGMPPECAGDERMLGKVYDEYLQLLY